MQQTLKDQVKSHLIKAGEERTKQKKAFWCTESEANRFDIYHNFKGTPPTNPISPETSFSLGMRKKLEEAVVETFGKMGILIDPEPYKNTETGEMVDSKQWRVEMERLGVPIVGYMDAVINEVEAVMSPTGALDHCETRLPVEIKTSYGAWSKKELLDGQVKTGYVKQLAQYMDFMNVGFGYLLVVNFERDLIIDDIYQFVVERDGNIFKCGRYTFDLYKDVYERYKRIWDAYIVPDIEPKSEYVYKYPLDKINWRTLTGSAISSARNNRAVIGDWQVKYSGYKDLIIQREGTTPGYTDAEINYIKEQTKGFTTWRK